MRTRLRSCLFVGSKSACFGCAGEQRPCTRAVSAQDVRAFSDGWQSGRMRTLGKRVRLNRLRGFESLPIRSSPREARKHRISRGIRVTESALWHTNTSHKAAPFRCQHSRVCSFAKDATTSTCECRQSFARSTAKKKFAENPSELPTAGRLSAACDLRSARWNWSLRKSAVNC